MWIFRLDYWATPQLIGFLARARQLFTKNSEGPRWIQILIDLGDFGRCFWKLRVEWVFRWVCAVGQVIFGLGKRSPMSFHWKIRASSPLNSVFSSFSPIFYLFPLFSYSWFSLFTSPLFVLLCVSLYGYLSYESIQVCMYCCCEVSVYELLFCYEIWKKCELELGKEGYVGMGVELPTFDRVRLSFCRGFVILFFSEGVIK